MKKFLLYAPIVLVAIMFLGFNEKATTYHWTNILEKIIFLGMVIGTAFLVNKFIKK